MIELEFYIKKLLDLESGGDWKEIYNHVYAKIHPMIYDSHYLKRSLYIKELEKFHNELIDLPFSMSSSDKLKFRKVQKHIVDLLYQIQEENKKIFVVHGADDHMLDKVTAFLGRLRLEYVVIEDKNKERKLKDFKKIAQECAYAVVLFSADDIAKNLSGNGAEKLRVSQNVIFQIGYFLSHAGRKNIVILHTEDKEIESPFDFDDVAFTPFDAMGNWKNKLIKEMEKSGIYIEKSLAFSGNS
jgi:predicted nucleotide-binding protein